MKWNIEIKEVPFNGGYQFTVGMKLDPDVAQKLMDKYDGTGGVRDLISKATPWMEGHAWNRMAVYDEIKRFIMAEEAKHPVSVFKDVIEIA